MAGFADILDSYIAGQNQALNTQLGVARLNAQRQQNLAANQLAREQFDFNKQQDERRTSFLESQDARQQSTFDRENAERARNQNLQMAIQSLDFTKENWTPEDALDPTKEGGWRALNNIPEVRELLGGEIRLAVVPGSENREDGPIYSFQVFNDKTGTTGPLTTLRGNQRDEFVVFHDREGVIEELNNIKNFVRSSLGVDPRYVTDATVSLMQQGSDAEAASTQAIPEIKPFGSAAINADRMGTTAAQPQNAPDTEFFRIPGSTPNAPELGASATAATTQTSAQNQSAPSTNNSALGTTRVATNPNPANSAQGAAINQRLRALSTTISQLEADYANARGQNPVQATQIYQQLQAAYNEQQQLADEYAQIGGPVTSSSQTPNQAAQPTPYNQRTTGVLGAPRVVTQPPSSPAAPAATPQSETAPEPAPAPQVAVGQPNIGNYLPYGYGSEERIARSAAALAQPFLDQANGARAAFNAASSYRGIVPSAEQLEAVNFSRRNNNITDAQASNLLSDGDMTGDRTGRAERRQIESRSIMNNATDNARQVVTNIQDNNQQVVTGAQTQAGKDNRKAMDIRADERKGPSASEWRQFIDYTSEQLDRSDVLDAIRSDATTDALGFSLAIDNWSPEVDDWYKRTALNIIERTDKRVLSSDSPFNSKQLSDAALRGIYAIQRQNSGDAFTGLGSTVDFIGQGLTRFIRDKVVDPGDIDTTKLGGEVIIGLGLSNTRPDIFFNTIYKPLNAKFNQNVPTAVLLQASGLVGNMRSQGLDEGQIQQAFNDYLRSVGN